MRRRPYWRIWAVQGYLESRIDQSVKSSAGVIGILDIDGLETNRHAAAKVIGREVTTYVANIAKYFYAFRMIEEQRAAVRLAD
jgi:hypothetical protein